MAAVEMADADIQPSPSIASSAHVDHATLRAIPLRQLHESGADYAEWLNALQIKPSKHDEFVTGALQILRRKHLDELRRASEANIRNLSYILIRGYGHICWVRDRAEWIVGDEEVRARGEEPLVPEREGQRDRLVNRMGKNERFYQILEPMWWHMRGIVFEVKSTPKKKGPKKGPMKGTKRKRAGTVASSAAADPEDAYQGDGERSELDLRSEEEPHERARQETLGRIEAEMAKRERWEIANSKGQQAKATMSPDDTDQAIVDLVLRLHQIRADSHPVAFERLWEAHIGRLEEMEDARLPAAAGVGADTNHEGQEEEDHQHHHHNKRNLANEPFNTHGNPLAPPPSKLLRATPATLSVYITASPALTPYTDRAYHWPDAPVALTDQERFFNGVLLRVALARPDIVGYVLSYGWNDVMRYVENSAGGRRKGWSLLQRDVRDAARLGVGVWRVKVLVVGSGAAGQYRQ